MMFWVRSGLTIERNWLKAYLFFAVPKKVDPTCGAEIRTMMELPPESYYSSKKLAYNMNLITGKVIYSFRMTTRSAVFCSCGT